MLNKNSAAAKFLILAIFSMAFWAVFILPFIAHGSGEPYVTTDGETNVTDDRATLNGFVDGNGLSTEVWFEYGRTTSMSSDTSKSSYSSSSRSFSKSISDLDSDTVYYFRAVAENDDGIVYGDRLSFRTDDTNDDDNNNNVEPDVTTGNVTDFTTTGATLHGSVDGNGSTTTAWFEYGTDTNLSSSTTHKSYGTSSRVFSAPVKNLSTTAIYYFRAVARNSEGTVYGNTVAFRLTANNSYTNTYTQDYQYYNYNYPTVPYSNSTTYASTAAQRSPTAVTEAASGISDNSAQLNSIIYTSASESSTSWFEWGTTPALGNKTVAISLGSLPAIRHANVLGELLPGTTYYFHVVAQNSSWRDVGSIMSFTTSGVRTIVQNVYTSTTIEDSATNVVKPAPTVTPAPAVLGASTIAANSFFPLSLFGWLLLIILVLILLVLIKHLSGSGSTAAPQHVQH